MSVATTTRGTATQPRHEGIASWLSTSQPRLGAHGLLALMVLATVFGSVASDMYAPALPELPALFNTTAARINLTMTSFYAAYAVGFLVFGPVSDKAGRRPVLIGGSLAFALGCALCAASTTVPMLVAARVVQALGAGAIDTMCTALAKDCFVEDKREQALAVVQTMFVISPIVGPLAGGVILARLSWHWIFICQAVVGAGCLVLSLLFEESLPTDQRIHEGLATSMGHLVTVAKNPPFLLFLLVMSAVNLPFMGYISASSYVYVEEFGLSEQVYTYFFAASALVAALGPSLSVVALRHLSGRRLVVVLLCAGIAAGVAMLVAGSATPFAFWAIFAVFALVEAAMRPFAANVLLMQQEGDSGSVSSLYNFACTALGVVGSALVMAGWPTYAMGLGVLMAVTMLLALVVWFAGMHAGIDVHGLDE